MNKEESEAREKEKQKDSAAMFQRTEEGRALTAVAQGNRKTERV